MNTGDTCTLTKYLRHSQHLDFYYFNLLYLSSREASQQCLRAQIRVQGVEKVMVTAFAGESTSLDQRRFVKKRLVAKLFILLISNVSIFYIPGRCKETQVGKVSAWMK